MSIYIKINDKKYPAEITGRLNDKDWGGRETKAITLKMTYDECINLFTDNCSWSIIQENPVFHNEMNENSEVVTIENIQAETYDNSDYCIAGPITDNRDGTVTVKMGKYTNEELLLMEVLS